MKIFIETQVNNQNVYRKAFLMNRFRRQQLKRQKAYEHLKALYPERYVQKKRVYKFKSSWKNNNSQFKTIL